MSEITQYAARHRYARTTARKARLVADMIRGRSVNSALELLQFSPKRASTYYEQLVRSAMANAAQDENVNVNRLVVSDCRADDGPLVQGRLRYRPGPQGRSMPIRKRTAHLTVQVAELGVEPEPRKKSTKKRATPAGESAAPATKKTAKAAKQKSG
jgi:large subunit ribosomal protein L22